MICILHGAMLFESFWLRNLRQEWAMAFMALLMLLSIALFRILSPLLNKVRSFLGLSALKQGISHE